VYCFAGELVLLSIALGFHFFENFFLVLDLFVVGGTIALGHYLGNSATGSVLIFLRMWRFVRIVHGVYATEHTRAEKKMEEALVVAQAENAEEHRTLVEEILVNHHHGKFTAAKEQLALLLPSEKADNETLHGLHAVQKCVLEFVHSDGVFWIILACLILDVVFTLSEFLISHSQCEFSKETYSHVILFLT